MVQSAPKRHINQHYEARAVDEFALSADLELPLNE